MKKIGIILLFVLLTGLSACDSSSGSTPSVVQVNSSWARSATVSNSTAAFMVLKNTSNKDVKLIKAESDVAGQVVLMDTQMKDGKSNMVTVDSIIVPANGQVELKSGGLHVMMMSLHKDLKVGDKFHLILTFDKSGAIQLDVPVQMVTPSQ